jgi:hypothetical protein
MSVVTSPDRNAAVAATNLPASDRDSGKRPGSEIPARSPAALSPAAKNAARSVALAVHSLPASVHEAAPPFLLASLALVRAELERPAAPAPTFAGPDIDRDPVGWFDYHVITMRPDEATMWVVLQRAWHFILERRREEEPEVDVSRAGKTAKRQRLLVDVLNGVPLDVAAVILKAGRSTVKRDRESRIR